MLNIVLLLQDSTIKNKIPYFYCGDLTPEVSIFRRDFSVVDEPVETDDYCVSISIIVLLY